MARKIKIQWPKDNESTFQASAQAVHRLMPHCKTLANGSQMKVLCSYWIWEEMREVGKKRKVVLVVFPDKPSQKSL